MFGDVLGIEARRVGPDATIVDHLRVDESLDAGGLERHPLDRVREVRKAVGPTDPHEDASIVETGHRGPGLLHRRHDVLVAIGLHGHREAVDVRSIHQPATFPLSAICRAAVVASSSAISLY